LKIVYSLVFISLVHFWTKPCTLRTRQVKTDENKESLTTSKVKRTKTTLKTKA